MQNNVFNELFAKGIFYEMVNGVKTAIQPKDVVVTLTAATANQTVIAAVSGKLIVPLEGNVYSEGAAATVRFLNGSGGAALKQYYVPANTLANPNVQLPRVEWGLMRTSSGTGLFATTSGGAAVVVSLTYLEVTA